MASPRKSAPAGRGSGVIARTRRTTTLVAPTRKRADGSPRSSRRTAFSRFSRSATARAADRAARRATRQPARAPPAAEPFFFVFGRFGPRGRSSCSRAFAAASRARAASRTDAPHCARRSASRSAASGSCAPRRCRCHSSAWSTTAHVCASKRGPDTRHAEPPGSDTQSVGPATSAGARRSASASAKGSTNTFWRAASRASRSIVPRSRRYPSKAAASSQLRWRRNARAAAGVSGRARRQLRLSGRGTRSRSKLRSRTVSQYLFGCGDRPSSSAARPAGDIGGDSMTFGDATAFPKVTFNEGGGGGAAPDGRRTRSLGRGGVAGGFS